MIDFTKGLAKSMQAIKEKMMHDLINEVFSQTYSVYKDEQIMSVLAGGEPNPLKIKELLAQMMGQDNLPLDNVWRVELRDNAKITLTDFTMPSSSTILKKTIPISKAPDFIRNGLAVLQIVQDDTLVDGVGKRVSETIYYILERHHGINTGEES